MPRVLLVDDAEDVHALLRALVRRARRPDIELVHASDGEEALARLENDHFDLVLTDLNMPVMGGMELLDALRAREDQTPVAIISGLIVERHPSAMAHVKKSELLSAPVDTIDRLFAGSDQGPSSGR